MDSDTLLDSLGSDLWNIIDEYLFNGYPNVILIKYLMTLRSLSELSIEMDRIIGVIKNKKSDEIISQNLIMHELLDLHYDSKYCAQCCYAGRGNSILYLCNDNKVLCEDCYLYDSSGTELNPQCSFCCYNGYENGKCYICYSDKKMITLDHWENDELTEYTICENCAIGNGFQGKRVLKVMHSYLSIIKN